jgi:hypothetical protein
MAKTPAPAATAALAAAALLATGCGGGAGDLMSLTVAGGPTGTRHTLVVSGDGRGSCDRGPLKALPSGRVIAAREIEREVGDLARRAAAYPPRPGARRYGLSTNAGVVRWSGGTPALPSVLPKAELLALQLERQLCP